jgi:hypothetical protein
MLKLKREKKNPGEKRREYKKGDKKGAKKGGKKSTVNDLNVGFCKRGFVGINELTAYPK